MPGATFDTLVDAHLKAHRFRNAAEPLRDWHARRLAGLQRLFRVTTLDEAANANEPRHASAIVLVCNDCLVGAARAHSPLAGFLEVPGDGAFRALFDRHPYALELAERALLREIRSTFADGLGVLFPEATTRVFTAAEMEAAGLGEAEPDEFDWL